MDLKELAKVIDLCRKKGVDSIEYEGIKVTLSPDAPASYYKKKQAQTQDTKDTVEPQTYSQQDALFWSSAGLPDEATQ